MAVPKHVQDQADRAEALRKQAYEKTEVQPAPGAPASPAPAVAVAVAAPAAPASPAAPVVEAPNVWEQRYNALQGKYNAEVPRLTASVKALEGKLSALVRVNDELTTKAATAPLLKPEEIQEYGQPLTDFIQRASMEKLAPILTELQRRLGSLDAISPQIENLQASTFATRRAAFFAGLLAAVPDWEKVNDDKSFLKWLEEVDPLARRTRQVMLEEAQAEFDVVGVASFFTSWKQAHGPASLPSLDANLTPGRSNASPDTPVNGDPSKRIWTQQEIAKFYDDWRRKLVSAKDAERIEQEINVAVQEGRVKTR